MEVTMKFRPCIDIHNGKVKQIVGGTLKDRGDLAAENFVSDQSAAFFCKALQLLSAFRRACDPFEFRRKRILSKNKGTGSGGFAGISTGITGGRRDHAL